MAKAYVNDASCTISRLHEAIPPTADRYAYGLDVVGKVGTEGVLLAVGVVHPMLNACGGSNT